MFKISFLTLYWFYSILYLLPIEISRLPIQSLILFNTLCTSHLYVIYPGLCLISSPLHDRSISVNLILLRLLVWVKRSFWWLVSCQVFIFQLLDSKRPYPFVKFFLRLYCFLVLQNLAWIWNNTFFKNTS